MAAIAHPLTALTRKDKMTGNTVVFEWNTECEESFNTLKKMLVTAPVLIPPDLSKEFFYGPMPVFEVLEQCWNRVMRMSSYTL